MASNNKQKKGGFVIQKLFIINHKGLKLDLDADFQLLTYTESIEKQWVEGSISFSDSVDFIAKNSIIGGEKLVFEYKVTDNSQTVTKNFIVTSATCSSSENSISQRNNNLLTFFSEEFVRSKNTSISKAYKNKSAKQIVEDVLSQINPNKEKLEVDPNIKSAHHIIIPNMDPLSAINFVCSISRHTSDKTSKCRFFPTSNGYSFVSNSYMFKKKPLGKFVRNLQVYDNGQPEKPSSILSITTISANPNMMESILSGCLASKTIAYDPLVKSYKEIEVDYISSFDSMDHLNEHPLLPKEFKEFCQPKQFVNYIHSNSLRKKSTYFKSNSEDTSHSNNIENQLPYNRLSNQMYSKFYKIEVKGDDCPSLFEATPRLFTIGEVIEVSQPNKTIEKDDVNKPNKYFNGKYLVSECQHVFRKDSYGIVAKICSDSNAEDH